MRKKEEEFFSSSEKSARQRRNVFGVKISPTPLFSSLSLACESASSPISKQKNAKHVLTPPLTFFFASSLATFSANFAVFLGVCLTAAASPATASPSPFDFFAWILTPFTLNASPASSALPAFLGALGTLTILRASPAALTWTCL